MNLKRYIRFGRCNRCAWCCPGEREGEYCKELEWRDNLPICKIYENRPESCKLFPEAPPILTDKCGYFFVDTWNNCKKLKPKEV